ncbi:MAG: hypothetical protein ACKPES_27710, partial [Dolichospermum sp.]
MLRFDKVFERFNDSENKPSGFLKRGKDLFRSQPACLGFVVAFSQAIMGMPGEDYSSEKQQKKWEEIQESANQLLEKLKRQDSQQ